MHNDGQRQYDLRSRPAGLPPALGHHRTGLRLSCFFSLAHFFQAMRGNQSSHQTDRRYTNADNMERLMLGLPGDVDFEASLVRPQASLVQNCRRCNQRCPLRRCGGRHHCRICISSQGGIIVLDTGLEPGEGQNALLAYLATVHAGVFLVKTVGMIHSFMSCE